MKPTTEAARTSPIAQRDARDDEQLDDERVLGALEDLADESQLAGVLDLVGAEAREPLLDLLGGGAPSRRSGQMRQGGLRRQRAARETSRGRPPRRGTARRERARPAGGAAIVPRWHRRLRSLRRFFTFRGTRCQGTWRRVPDEGLRGAGVMRWRLPRCTSCQRARKRAANEEKTMENQTRNECRCEKTSCGCAASRPGVAAAARAAPARAPAAAAAGASATPRSSTLGGRRARSFGPPKLRRASVPAGAVEAAVFGAGAAGADAPAFATPRGRGRRGRRRCCRDPGFRRELLHGHAVDLDAPQGLGVLRLQGVGEPGDAAAHGIAGVEVRARRAPPSRAPGRRGPARSRRRGGGDRSPRSAGRR